LDGKCILNSILTHTHHGRHLQGVIVDSIHLWADEVFGGHCCVVRWQWHNTHLQPAMTQPDPVHSTEEIIFQTLTHTFLSCHLRWLRRLLAEWQEWDLSQEYNYFCPLGLRSDHFIWNHVFIWCGEDMPMLFTHKSSGNAEKVMSSHNGHW